MSNERKLISEKVFDNHLIGDMDETGEYDIEVRCLLKIFKRVKISICNSSLFE